MIKDSLLMAMTSFILMLIGIVSQYFLAHYLTQGEYGEFQLIISWIAVLSFFSLNSFNTIVTKASAQNYSLFFRKASIIGFLFSITGSVLLFIVAIFFEVNKIELFIIAAIFFPFYTGINFAQNFYTGKKEYKKYSILVIGTQLLVSSSQIILLLISNSLKEVMFVSLLATSIVNLFITIFIIKKLKNEKKNKERELELTKYGIQLSLINIIPAIAGKIQFIILNAYTSPVILAIYAAAQIFPDKVKGLFKSLIVPFSVYLASKEKEKSLRIVKNSIPLLLIYGIISTIIIIIILPVLISIVYGDKYNASIYYALFLVVDLIFMPINGIISSVIIYHGYKKTYGIITIVKSALSIILYLILIPFYSIYGIVFTVIFLSLATFLLHLFWLYKTPLPIQKQSVLYIRKQEIREIHNLQVLKITTKFESINIIKIIEANYLLKDETYPIWVKLIAKLSFTKKM